MLTLLELQRGFRSAMLDGDDAAIGHLVLGDGVKPSERLDIHRNNIVASLTSVLADTFPVIRRLGDERFFAYAAHEFVGAHPPARPCLAEYGAGFADFLATFPACSDFAYFADVARLEWLLHEAARAPEVSGLPVAALRDVAPESTPRLVLTLQPSLGYLASRFPVDRIWSANQGSAAGRSTVALDSGGARLEIRRFAGHVGMRALPEGDFAFRAALGAGSPLESAAEGALAAVPEFDLPAALASLFAEAAVVAIRVAPDTGDMFS